MSKASNGSFQGRASYLPTGAKRKTQRSVGLFDSAAEAGLKVAEAEAVGEAFWDSAKRTNTHKRGTVQCPIFTDTLSLHVSHGHTRCCCSLSRQAPPASEQRKTARRWGVYTTEASRIKNEKVKAQKEKAKENRNETIDERDPNLPTSVPMPSSIKEVQNTPMANMLAQA